MGPSLHCSSFSFGLGPKATSLQALARHCLNWPPRFLPACLSVRGKSERVFCLQQPVSLWAEGPRSTLSLVDESSLTRVASACSSLKQGFGSGLEIEVGSWLRERRILDVRPVVSDKVLALQLCRREFPWRRKTVKQEFIRRKKSTVHLIVIWVDSESRIVLVI